ncbi:hypothetical protein [Litoribacillus peritrichatus]|uniref:Uncharacterized protein n=1 Tax=Litoribacillus peritrichatus TaxID=718191 RepID=A0ABP7N3S6_9GAMM
MSMSLYLFLTLDTPLKTKNLNEAAKSLGVPIVYEENIDLAGHAGFLPAVLNGLKTGVEVYKTPYSQVAELLASSDSVDPDNTVVIEFRWGGDFYEGTTALYTAMIYSAKYNGVAFDPMSGRYLGADQLVQGVEAFLSYGEQ